MIDNFIAFIFVIFTLFPLGYAFYKKAGNKLFFIVSIVGAYVCILSLLWIIGTPFFLFQIKIIPELAEQASQQGKNLNTLLLTYLNVANLIQNWWYLIHPVLAVYLPISIYRRYPMFHLETESNHETTQRSNF